MKWAVAVLLVGGLVACGDDNGKADRPAACAEVDAKANDLNDEAKAINADIERHRSRESDLNYGNGPRVRAEARLRQRFAVLAALVKQHPDCFSPSFRAEVEARAR